MGSGLHARSFGLDMRPFGEQVLLDRRQQTTQALDLLAVFLQFVIKIIGVGRAEICRLTQARADGKQLRKERRHNLRSYSSCLFLPNANVVHQQAEPLVRTAQVLG